MFTISAMTATTGQAARLPSSASLCVATAINRTTAIRRRNVKSLSRSAEWYARHGWHVVPLHQPLFHDGHLIGCSCETWRRQYVADYVCPTPGKHPRISDWENQATRELGIIRQWWQRWPNANVGIAAGKSGLLTLDADTYKDGYEGDHLLTREDEETVTNLTGNGDTHLLYQMREGSWYTSSKVA